MLLLPMFQVVAAFVFFFFSYYFLSSTLFHRILFMNSRSGNQNHVQVHVKVVSLDNTVEVLRISCVSSTNLRATGDGSRGMILFNQNLTSEHQMDVSVLKCSYPSILLLFISTIIGETVYGHPHTNDRLYHHRQRLLYNLYMPKYIGLRTVVNSEKETPFESYFQCSLLAIKTQRHLT